MHRQTENEHSVVKFASESHETTYLKYRLIQAIVNETLTQRCLPQPMPFRETTHQNQGIWSKIRNKAQ